MAHCRVVDYVLRDSNGVTTHLGGGGEVWSPRPVERAIEDIESGRFVYVTVSWGVRSNRIHVVNGESGKYLRSGPDSTTDNNLDSLGDPLPKYVGNYPDHFHAGWTQDLQGVTHNDDHWFFTQKKRIIKFHVSTDLSSDLSEAVETVSMPDSLTVLDCDHFGDPDYITVEGQGYLLIPVEGEEEGQCNREPLLAVFKDESPMTFLGSHPLLSQHADFGTGRAGWCAVNLGFLEINQKTPPQRSPTNVTFFPDPTGQRSLQECVPCCVPGEPIG